MDSKDQQKPKLKCQLQEKGIPLSEEHRKKIGDGRRGKLHSLKTKEQMSKQRKGRKSLPFSDEHLRNMSIARRRRVISEETKKKISKSLKKIGHGEWKLSQESKQRQKEAVFKALTGKEKEKVKCPHCGKIGGKPVMMRYHFDNCKNKL